MWGNTGGKSVGLLPARQFVGPLLAMLLTPPFVIILHFTLIELDGSLRKVSGQYLPYVIQV